MATFTIIGGINNDSMTCLAYTLLSPAIITA